MLRLARGSGSAARVAIPALLLLGLCACAVLACVHRGARRDHRAQRHVPAPMGNVLLSAFARQANVPPVTFQHWRHRSRYTCRACHVDVGFAMLARATGVSASSNRDGQHCGACHDGRHPLRGTVVFSSCSDVVVSGPLPEPCTRCHRAEDPAREAADHAAFLAGMPRTAGGDVDWVRAEETGVIHVSDFVPGASVYRGKPLRIDKEVALELTHAPRAVFSHRKHAVWNGCELCHPDIFPMASGRLSGSRMNQIISGEFCGVCHGKVAFPLLDHCDRCHER